jgi:hypothetical protein
MLGGSEGEGLLASAEAALRPQGVRQPARLAATFVPMPR